MNKSGIYLIRNTENGKVYVGSTGDTIAKRWSCHKTLLRHNKHTNSHLQSAWNKYGKDSFECLVLEECDSNMLIIREDAWINYYDSMNREKGYNLEPADRHIKTEEHKRKIGLGNTGKVRSKEANELNRIAHLGKKASKETKEKMRNSSRAIPICQYSLDGKLIKEHRSQREAYAFINNVEGGSICENLKGRQATAYGFIWKYKGESFKPATYKSRKWTEERRILMCKKLKGHNGPNWTDEQKTRISNSLKKYYASKTLKSLTPQQEDLYKPIGGN